jgi:hypothetical protein
MVGVLQAPPLPAAQKLPGVEQLIFTERSTAGVIMARQQDRMVVVLALGQTVGQSLLVARQAPEGIRGAIRH